MTRPPVDRLTGQELARRELSKAIYHQRENWIQRVLDAIGRYLDRFTGTVPGGWFSVLALIALVLIIAVAVLIRIGFVRTQGARRPGPLAGRPRTAREYRENAERLAKLGQFTEAIIDGLRAVAAELAERGVLANLPGRTADELAAEAGRLLPGLAPALTTAARLFNEVRYGDRAGTRAGYEQLRALDEAVLATRPATVAAQSPAAQSAAAQSPAAQSPAAQSAAAQSPAAGQGAP